MEKIYRIKHIIEERIESVEDALKDERINFALGNDKGILEYNNDCAKLNERLRLLNMYLDVYNKYIEDGDLNFEELSLFRELLKYFK